jgi:hypothetical protein
MVIPIPFGMLLRKYHEVKCTARFMLRNMTRHLLEVITMKKLVLAAAMTVAASSAFAGSLADPIIEAPVIVEEASSSSAGVLVPILILVLVAAALAD